MTNDPAGGVPAVDLDAIEARAAAATPGPWEPAPEYGEYFYAYQRGEYFRGVGQFSFGDGEEAEADRAFVMAAAVDVPALVAYARSLEAENARLQQEVLSRYKASAWDLVAEQRDQARVALARVRAVLDAHGPDGMGSAGYDLWADVNDALDGEGQPADPEPVYPGGGLAFTPLQRAHAADTEEQT